jgi:hypothetical protein
VKRYFFACFFAGLLIEVFLVTMTVRAFFASPLNRLKLINSIAAIFLVGYLTREMFKAYEEE